MAKSTVEKMKERLRTLEAAEVELVAADAEVQTLTQKVEEADLTLRVARAKAVGGGWKDRQTVKTAEADRRAFAEDLERARKIAEAKRHAVEDLRDETGILKAEASDRLMSAAIRQAAELMEDVRRKQEDLVAVARKAVAVYSAAANVIPRKVVSQRVPGKFLRVVSSDPTLQGIYKGNKPPGSFNLEPLKALAGARDGKWEIAEGQDLTIDPKEIETVWREGSVPQELESIRELRLGNLIGGTGEVDFHRLASLVTEEEIKAAAKELEG